MKKACARCGTRFEVKPSHARKRTYCSRLCMAAGYRNRMRGTENPNFKGAGVRPCLGCGRDFKHYDKNRKYCRRACYERCGAARENAVKNGKRSRMFGTLARVDGNQAVIVKALRKVGAQVFSLAKIGNGVPDLLVNYKGKTYLVEVKNPSTAYGRAGLNANQKAWFAKWQGGHAAVVSTVDQAFAVIGFGS